MYRLLASSALFALAAPALAHATTVYPGCAVPSMKAGHHTFYIDPVNGSMQGDGSAGKPWHTLAEVLAPSSKLLSTTGHNARTWRTGDTSLIPVNPAGPIKPGDVLLLENGDHGDVKILNAFNPDFVTVMAAPGQTPTLSSLAVVSSSRWLFQGLKILGAHPTPPGTSALVSFGRGDFLGTTSDIVIDSSTMLTTADTSSWSSADWNNKPDSYLVLTDQHASCMAVTNNQFMNGRDAIAFGADNSIAKDNVIIKMRYDGIDFYGSNQILQGNTIKDGVNDFASNALHPDGIQGWSVINKGVPQTNKNDVIDGNTIIKTGNGKVTQMQGISIFDGDWDGLQIINNVVVTNVYHGIAIYGGKNVSILNNTVLKSDPAYSTWIVASKSKSNQPGQNIVIRNNITSNLVIAYPGPTYDHNVVADAITLRDAANKVTVMRSGTVGNANKIGSAVANEFVTANASTGLYDLRLRPNSMAIAAGTPLQAPTVDIVGRKRSTPVDAGAYEH